jgi:hypothetical protein
MPESPALDFYASATSPKASATTTLEDLIEAIQGDEFAPKIAKLRAALAAGDDDRYAVAKKDLQAVSISGTCDGKRANAIQEGRFTHSGFLQLDFDAVDNIGWDVGEIVHILQGESRIVAAFVSPSGHGVKGIARIPVCKTKEEHAAAFAAARNHFRAANLVIDEACKDPVRLMFISHDPNAWIDLSRTAAFECIADAAPELPAAEAKPKGGLILKAKSSEFPPPPQHGIHTWLMEAAWWCRFNDMTESETVERLRSHDGSLRRALQPTEAVDAARQVFSSPMPESSADWKLTEQVTALITRPPGNSTMQSFDPDDVFYDGPASKYLVRVGNAFFTYSKLSPIVTGIARHLSDQYTDPKELMRAVKATVANRELDGGIQWHGNLAGHRQGLSADSTGLPILITSEAKPPQPTEGEFPIITDLLTQAFANPTAMEVFMSWLAGRWVAVNSYTHIPSPMLVLAGEVNSGKSLLAWIVTEMLGGRVANPYAAWSGGILWNDDLVGSELLLIDDCSASTDIRARRAFGAAFKEAMYPQAVQLRKRHSSSVSVRPVWAVMVACNDTPEALQIIPPLDADMSDKIILLHFSPVTLPMDTSTPEGRREFQQVIKAEMPALAATLRDWQTPEELRDSRSGVMAWRDPELVDSVDSASPARRIEQLLETAIEHRGIWHDIPREFTAMEIESRLTENGSPVRDQAKQMFSWHGACGSALVRLAAKGEGLVTRGSYDPRRKVWRYHIAAS